MPTSEDSKEREVLQGKESKHQVRHKALARAHSQTLATSKHTQPLDRDPQRDTYIVTQKTSTGTFAREKRK